MYSEPYLATLGDLDVITYHRDAMFAEIGLPRDERFVAMIDGGRAWLRAHLEAGTYCGFFVAHAGRIVSGADSTSSIGRRRLPTNARVEDTYSTCTSSPSTGAEALPAD